jgi:ATPase related to the helicase subunit of the Holliday junction resolvase
MIAAGEDPKFIARRLIISASEDVGNADPRALQVAIAAGQALDWIGLPEAQYALAQATVAIASSVKSDSVGRAYAAAVQDVLSHGALPVPNHLRNAADRRLKQHGIGVGYRNPHDYEGDDVEQHYLPDALVGKRYYVPSDQGYELTIAARMETRAEARRQPPRRKRIRFGADPMGAFGSTMKAAGEARAKLAKTQRDDASD